MKYLPILVLLLTSKLQAQSSFSLTPNPVFSEIVDEFIDEGRATIKNLASSTQNFRWKRTIIRLDNDSICFTAVTDPNLHWFPAVSEKNFSMEPGQEGPLYVTLFDFEQTGCCAIAHMKIKNLSTPTDSIEAFYYLRTCQPLAVLEVQTSSVTIYPNPSVQYFRLQNAESVSQLILCDATGKLLKQMQAKAENRYEVSDLPLGAYYLILKNDKGAVVQVTQFQKANE